MSDKLLVQRVTCHSCIHYAPGVSHSWGAGTGFCLFYHSQAARMSGTNPVARRALYSLPRGKLGFWRSLWGTEHKVVQVCEQYEPVTSQGATI